MGNPSDFATLVLASSVSTGRLCCRRWATGDDCVRPCCGPLAPANPPGVDEPDKKPRLAPAENGGWRPSVCERPCVGLRGTGIARGRSGGPDSDLLDLAPGAWIDAERPFVLMSASGSAPPASDGASAVWLGAWMGSAKVLPDWMGGETEGVCAGSSEVESERGGGVAPEGAAIGCACSEEGRGDSGQCELVGGEWGPD